MPVIRSLKTAALTILFASGLLSGCGGNAGSSEDVGASADSASPSVTQKDGDSLSEGQSGKVSSDRKALNEDQRQRLGPALRRLFAGDTLSQMPEVRMAEPVGERGGEEVFSVIIEGADPERLRAASLPITSAVGGVVTTRLTISQIRKAASLEDVQRVRLPNQATPQQTSP